MARIHINVPDHEKTRIKAAAAARGETTTEFMRNAVNPVADAVLEAQDASEFGYVPLRRQLERLG